MTKPPPPRHETLPLERVDDDDPAVADFDPADSLEVVRRLRKVFPLVKRYSFALLIRDNEEGALHCFAAGMRPGTLEAIKQACIAQDDVLPDDSETLQ